MLRRLTGRRSMAERYLERGLHHLDKGEYEDALADVSAAIALEPYNAELYATRGFIYLESGADNPAYADYAQEDLEYALYLDPEQWVAEYCLGMMAYAEGDYHEALRRFNAAYERAPLRPEVYYYRALCHNQLGDPAQAAAEMELAIDLFPRRDSRKRDARKWLRMFKKAAKSRRGQRVGRRASGALPPGRPSVTEAAALVSSRNDSAAKDE